MPSWNQMSRLAAADPSSMAEFFDVMSQLFLKYIFGVRGGAPGCVAFPDGAATEFGRGVLGPVTAFHGPIETNGRGGLHAHYLVWLAQPMTAHVLDKLKRGELDEEMKAVLDLWQKDVLRMVGSMQHESVEEACRRAWYRPFL